MQLDFFVPGTPVPKGSAKAFMNKHTGNIAVMQDNAERQKPWASSISYTAMQRMNFQKPVAGAVELSVSFFMPRPKAHYGTGKNSGVIKDSCKLTHHVSKPDLDKLIRCVKDALTGVAWNDDSQVIHVHAKKVYESPGFGIGASIFITEVR